MIVYNRFSALVAINCNAVSGKSAKQRLATLVYDKMLKFIEQEGEKGLCMYFVTLLFFGKYLSELYCLYS